MKLAFVRGYGFSPYPVWLDADNGFFGFSGGMSLLPVGYEANAQKLKDIQEDATAAMVRDVAHTFLIPENATPTVINNVLLFDSVAGKYLSGQSVLIGEGKVAQVGAAGSFEAPKDATIIDGKGKTLVPGLWDAHLHVGDDWNLLQNLATGLTNYRSPGSLIEDALSINKRRAAGDRPGGKGLRGIGDSELRGD